MEMGKTWFLWGRCAFSFEFLLLFFYKQVLLWVVAGGGFNVGNLDDTLSEILCASSRVATSLNLDLAFGAVDVNTESW